jgi:hypothetical protein
VLTYRYGSTDARVVFDRPLAAKQEQEFTNQCSVAMGKYVTAGERFESFRPGYQVVKNQQTMPRFELPVESAHVREDKRSFLLRTAEGSEAVNYALTLPAAAVGSNREIDVLTDLTGVQTMWESAENKATWSGWLPHLDLTAARGFTVGSA